MTYGLQVIVGEVDLTQLLVFGGVALEEIADMDGRGALPEKLLLDHLCRLIP